MLKLRRWLALTDAETHFDLNTEAEADWLALMLAEMNAAVLWLTLIDAD